MFVATFQQKCIDFLIVKGLQYRFDCKVFGIFYVDFVINVCKVIYRCSIIYFFMCIFFSFVIVNICTYVYGLALS